MMQHGSIKVVSPIQDAPAARAGVMANDIITHLEGKAMQGKPLNEVLDKMRGPINTAIHLRILRKGQNEPIELTVVRASIQSPEVDLQVAAKDGKLQVEVERCPFSTLRKVHRSRSSQCRATNFSSLAAIIRALRSCAMRSAGRQP